MLPSLAVTDTHAALNSVSRTLVIYDLGCTSLPKDVIRAGTVLLWMTSGSVAMAGDVKRSILTPLDIRGARGGGLGGDSACAGEASSNVS